MLNKTTFDSIIIPIGLIEEANRIPFATAVRLTFIIIKLQLPHQQEMLLRKIVGHPVTFRKSKSVLRKAGLI